MNGAEEIIQQVYKAKTDTQAADRLISAYMPFIRGETAKYLKQPLEGHDDEVSIAMIAFHEAVNGYSRVRGPFLKYASMLIKSRLIDYGRRERRHSRTISLELPAGQEEMALKETLAEDVDRQEELVLRNATRNEIEELARQMKDFGISLGDVADNCPKQKRTLESCRKAFQYARGNQELLDEFLRTKKLPIGQLAKYNGVERKTLERHRKYMVALLLICTNGFEIIRGHLKQVMKGVAV